MQASDEYVAVRNARVVLIDPERVRAVMTASWLEQMGWNEVYVLDDPRPLPMEGGPRQPPEVAKWGNLCPRMRSMERFWIFPRAFGSTTRIFQARGGRFALASTRRTERSARWPRSC